MKKIYGGVGVSYSAAASKELERLERMDMGGLPVCMAKTQYSLTDCLLYTSTDTVRHG